MADKLKPVAILAEDNEGLAEIITGILSRAGYEVRHGNSVAYATLDIRAIEAGREFALLVTDFVLKGDRTGEHLIFNARKEHPGIPVVVVSGSDQEEVQAAITARGIDIGTIEMCPKPLEQAKFMRAIENAIAKAPSTPAGHRDRLEARDTSGGITGP